MKCLVVSSTVTFVPDNYEAFINSLAGNPHVYGVILIENREWSVVAKALALILTAAAPRMGWHLLKNYFGGSTQRKKKAYLRLGKSFQLVADINSPQVVDFVKSEQIDLIINARTRSFFKKNILSAPRWGCINIHHGLLPEQRGLMCDFWAHLEKTSFGFSIHQMTSKLDDGPILKVTEVKTNASNYLESIHQASLQEAESIKNLLEELSQDAEQNLPTGLPGKINLKNPQTKYRSNPKLTDFYKLQLRGTKI